MNEPEPFPCPYCGRTNTHNIEPGGAEPVPGDRALCWGCRQLLVFGGDGRLRLPTPAERADAEADEEWQRAVAAAELYDTPLAALEALRRPPER